MARHDKDYFKRLGKLLDEHAPPVYPETAEEFFDFLDQGWAFFKAIKTEPDRETTAMEFYKKWMNLHKKNLHSEQP